MTALDCLQADPFLPAREAATRWNLLIDDDVHALEQEDIEHLLRNQANVSRPMFELIPDATDHYPVPGMGCAVCGAT